MVVGMRNGTCRCRVGGSNTAARPISNRAQPTGLPHHSRNSRCSRQITRIVECDPSFSTTAFRGCCRDIDSPYWPGDGSTADVVCGASGTHCASRKEYLADTAGHDETAKASRSDMLACLESVCCVEDAPAFSGWRTLRTPSVGHPGDTVLHTVNVSGILGDACGDDAAWNGRKARDITLSGPQRCSLRHGIEYQMADTC
ncbi:hypothetical protein P171DRAFT_430059 [Karstenula rhodostoma CBS 690.94]|uniref:Uncharacterized protein n=1 Tax=Karstenula rhodostoma CBS 690.94 TaxID=1392251 RepID=A0A9P4UEH7_9PLEO|nr:hypothetical protein P171DRAFT_430059 [Karstenula rhodostoma CBS 690.94]